MYRSMIIGEGEKIRSVPSKHILIFVGLIIGAGFIFKFGFMNIFQNMNKHNIRTPVTVLEDAHDHQSESEESEMRNNNMYKIIGIIDGHYIVETTEGLRKVKTEKANKKIYMV